MKRTTYWMALAAAGLAMAGLATGARGETETVAGVEWEYEAEDEAAMVTGASPAEGALTIPSLLGGIPVESIEDWAFSECDKVTSLTIPEGVTTIGEHAFEGCLFLETLTIPGSLERIGEAAFAGCPRLAAATIPDRVMTAESSIFAGCDGLASISVPHQLRDAVGDWGLPEGCEIVVRDPLPLGIATPAVLPVAFAETDYWQELQATGGEEPYTWEVVDGAEWPEWLDSDYVLSWEDLGEDGAYLSGWPCEEDIGTSTFTLRVTDSAGASAERTFTLEVGENPDRAPIIESADPETWHVWVEPGQSRRFAVEAHDPEGAAVRYAWVVYDGEWDEVARWDGGEGGNVYTWKTGAGMAGDYYVSVEVDDGENESTRDWWVTVGRPATLAIATPTVLPVAFAETDYWQELQATGGEEPYTWEVADETEWPEWLDSDYVLSWEDLGEDGAYLSGWPSEEDIGTSTFTLRVTDSAGASAERTFTLEVGENPDRAPIIESEEPGTWRVWVEPGQSQRFSVEAHDPEGAAIRHVWMVYDSEWDEIARWDGGEEGNDYTWKTDADMTGDYYVSVEVDDGENTTCRDWWVTLGNPSDSPGIDDWTTWTTGVTGKIDGDAPIASCWPIAIAPKWTAQPYTVAFDGAGGKGTMAPQQMVYGTAAALRKNAFTRKGYVFAGWSKTKGGAVAFWNGAKVKNLSATGGTVKLYAKWAKKHYQVAFNANGGKGKMAAQPMTYGKAAQLKKNVFQRKGWTFFGWAKTKTGAVAYGNGASVKNLRTDGKTTTLYAKWAKKNYQVAFNANGGKGKMAAQTMTYGKAAQLKKNAFQRKGWTFLGWAKTKTGAVAYGNGASVKNLRTDGKTTALYAKWAKKNYQVAFNANGGKGKMAAQTMTYGKAAKLKKNAFRWEGWTFLGWAKTKTGAVAYANGASVKNLRTDGKTTTLYAKWAKKTYKVTFNANGGTGKMASQSMTYGKAAKLKKNAFRRKGYSFFGWAKTKTGAVAYADGATVKNLRKDGKTTALYAKWIPTTYRIAFHANDGRGTTAVQWIQYDAAAKLRANTFSREGYSFLGWSKTAKGKVVYANGATVKNLSASGGTVDLFAKWKANGKVAKKVAKRGTGAAKTVAGTDEVGRVFVTASGGENADAVADGDEGTAWTADAAGGAWVVLAFAEALDVGEIEVVGENLPDGIRFLLSEDAEEWREEVPGRARYVWVAFPASEEPLAVKEIRVLPE